MTNPATIDVRPVLRTGCLAYFDAMQGLLPVKVLKITGPSGAPSSEQYVEFQLTANRGAWKRGEKHTARGLRVVPRNAVRARRLGARITYYTVESNSK